MKNYKLLLEYEGTKYAGLQKQNSTKNTIVEVIEHAAKKVLGDDIFEIVFSGRTDAGVHAFGQVINIKTNATFAKGKLALALNYYLREEDISCVQSELVPLEFNSRYSCQSRTYLYKILNRSAKSPIFKNRVWLVPYKLDLQKMILCANLVKGTHDFSFFRNIKCEAKSPIRTVDDIAIVKNDDFIEITITAKSFLYRMVRNIVGVLIEIGRNNLQQQDLVMMLENKSKYNIKTAPACGLYFVSAKY